MVKFIVRISK